MSTNQQEEVPEGYELEFTGKGIPYLKKIKEEDEESEDEEAMMEHATGSMSIFSSMDKIEKRYGVGYRLYYNFVKFIQLTNLVLVLICAVNWIPYFFIYRPDKEFPDEFKSFMQEFFISSYPQEMRLLWMITTMCALVITFIFPILYHIYLSKRLSKFDIADHDNPFAFSGLGVDNIPGNDHFTSTQRFIRRCVSYTLTLIGLGVSFLVLYFIQYYTVDFKGIYMNFVLSGVLWCINTAFRLTSRPLTAAEKPLTFSALRKHVTIKFTAFKIFNLIALYAAKKFAFLDDPYGCGLQDIGDQFFSLMIFELVVSSISEFASPVLRRKVLGLCLANKGSDDSAKPEFDLAEEYMELFYRQFIVYMGFGTFPMVTLMAFITNLLEYPLDKIRMLKVCQKPVRVDFGMKRFLIVWMFVVAFLAVVAYPQGTAWQLILNKGAGFCSCNILPGECPLGDEMATSSTTSTSSLG